MLAEMFSRSWEMQACWTMRVSEKIHWASPVVHQDWTYDIVGVWLIRRRRNVEESRCLGLVSSFTAFSEVLQISPTGNELQNQGLYELPHLNAEVCWGYEVEVDGRREVEGGEECYLLASRLVRWDYLSKVKFSMSWYPLVGVRILGTVNLKNEQAKSNIRNYLCWMYFPIRQEPIGRSVRSKGLGISRVFRFTMFMWSC